MQTPGFVGRRDELAALGHALSEAGEGRPQLVLVSGEAGVGKTRLVDELCARAAKARAMVFRGRAREELYATFQPIAEVVRAQLREAPEALERLLGKDVERLRDLARGETPLGVDDLSEARPHQQLVLYAAVSRATLELARLRTCVVVLDDLHWADGPSLEQLQHLVFAASDAAQSDALRLLMVAAFRPPQPDAALGRTLARLDREPIARSLALAELPAAAVGELIEDVAGHEPTKALVGDVRSVAGGNPLFVQATVAALQSLGALSARDGQASLRQDIDLLDLPRDLLGSLGAPAESLSDRCRMLLTFAAACGDDLEPRELASLLELPPEDVAALIEEGHRAALLVWEGETFRFRHPLVRQALYQVLGPMERQRVHLEIAARLEKRGEPPTQGDARETLRLAHHLVRAASLCEPERLADAAERAGEVAFAESAWQNAARLFGAAARALEGRSDVEPARVAQLRFRCGLSHYRDMDVAVAVEHYERALETLGRDGDPALRAQLLVERTRTRLTRGDVAFSGAEDTRPLEEALDALGDREPERRAQLCHMLSEMCWTGGDADQGAEWGQRGAEIARRHNAPMQLSQCLTSLAMAQSNQLRLAEARASLEEALAAADRSGDRWTQGQPLQRLPLVLAWLGRLAEAERLAEEACRLTRETQDWAEHSLGLAVLVVIAVIRGRFADAERDTAEALRTARRAHYPWGAAVALSALAGAHAYRNDAAGAERTLAQTSGRDGAFAEAGPALTFLGTVYRQLIASQAGEAPEGPLAISLLANNPDFRPDMQVLGALCAGAETARNLGDSALAARCYDLIAKAGDRGVLFPSGWILLVPRVLGVAASANREWERAETHFLEAAAAAEAAGAPPEMALTALDHAAMCLERGAEGDRERAKDLLERADAIARELALDAVIDRIAGVASGAGLRLRHEGHWRGLDPRKQDLQMATDGSVERVLLVSDMAGSTTLFDRFGDAGAEAVVERHNMILRACLNEYSGREVQHTGDGVIASFTSVNRALACAVAMQRDLVAYNESHPERTIRIRVGVHRGHTTPVEDRLIGAALNATVRIANAADADEIYVSEGIRETCDRERFALTDRGDHTLKGFNAPLRLHELLWKDAP